MTRPKKLAAETLEGPATVFPVDGHVLVGVPHVPLSADDATAARLVATGAFRYEAPELPNPDPETGITEAPEIEVIPFPESAIAALDFYSPVPEPDPETEAGDEPEQEA